MKNTKKYIAICALLLLLSCGRTTEKKPEKRKLLDSPIEIPDSLKREQAYLMAQAKER